MRKISDAEMVKCDLRWKNPLPSRFKTKYEECFMKQKLEYLFPDTFVDLKVKDKPDLQSTDGKYGIEVTSAIPKDEQEVLQLSSDILYHQARQPEKVNNKISKLGGKLMKYGLTGPNHDCAEHYGYVKSCIKNKLDCLNSGKYTIFGNNYLAIESEFFLNDYTDSPNAILQDIKKNIYCDYSIVFGRIYIFSPFELYLLDFKNEQVNIIKLDTHEMSRCSCEARLMVENNEVIP